MTNFTRLFSLIVLISIVGLAQAQTYDLSISAVGTASNGNNEIPAGLSAPISFTIKNNGTNDIPAATEFWIAVEVNSNYFIQPDTISFTGAFPAGGEFGFYTTTSYLFEGTNPNYEICASAVFVNPALEANPNNNTTCEDYVASSAVHNDWAAVSISIASPTDLDGFDLDDNTNTVPELDSVLVTIKNNSDITYPTSFELGLGMALNGDTIFFNANINGGAAPGAELSGAFTNPNTLPTMPQDSGTYSLCLVMNAIADNVDSNDVECESFTIIDSYNPFHPSNWPSGVNEVSNESFNVVPLVDQVLINGVVNPTDVTILDMSGRTVQEVQFTEDGSIQLDTEKSGVYIIQASDATSGQVEVQKFTKH